MSSVSFALCADDVLLSRVDRSSMPDQTVMELLVSDVRNIAILKDAAGDFFDINQWKGVFFSDDDKVNRIKFCAPSGLDPQLGLDIASADDPGAIGPVGIMDLRWIPESVTEIELYALCLEGTVETSLLPRGMLSFDVAENEFRGTFCIDRLPEEIESVSIPSNHFEGSLNMPSAPKTLQYMEANNNEFSGSLNLTELPGGLRSLYLNNNEFSGFLDLSSLSSGLRYIQLDVNNFKQDRLVVRVPKAQFGFFRVDREKFREIVDQNGDEIRYNV